jgi:LysM repeat protein
MRLWFLVKFIALFAVLGVMGFTAMLAYHVLVEPLGGVFEKIIPNPHEIAHKQPDVDFAKMLDSAELPDIDPGEKAFQKAHELIALGQLPEAREKLTAIVNVFPTSPSAPIARRIVGDMNLDEILSASYKEGKQVHTVKRGDSYFAIAGKYKTTLDCIMFLNGMLELGNLQPGDELNVMPLEFRLLIEPQRQSISIWDGGRFIREYPILKLQTSGHPLANQRTTIESKFAVGPDSKRIQPQAKGYRGAKKVIQLSKVPVPILTYDPADPDQPRGIFLSGPDVEELTLLTRAGNEVEIRNPKR